MTLASATVGVTYVPAAGVGPAPKLELAGTRPVKIKGTGFRSHERVRLILRQPSGVSRRKARADVDGAFSSTFSSATTDRCHTFSVRAKGDAGSEASLMRRVAGTCIPP